MTQTDLSQPGSGSLGASLAAPAVPRSLSTDRLRLAIALTTLAAFAVAESLTVFTNPFTGIALHALTLSVLLIASGFGGQGDSMAKQPLSRLLYALALVPLIRIVSLTMPLGRFDETYWFVAAGLPVFVAALIIMAGVGLRPRDVGLSLGWPALHLHPLVILFGLVLGFAEYHILRPEPLIDGLTLSRFVIPALVLMLATGFLEEFIFRGILQRTATAALGPLAIIYVSVIFAILHIGYRSGTDIVFVFLIALLYGWVVRKTGSIIGVSVSHGVTNITLFLLVPFIPVLAAQPDWLPPIM
ncbi:MAG: CPBP family intramembrane metalloprotease [Chloroflexi bacterium]|nr:CPBP family intramembrane metalloprotease [Chloroflexota bacterium]